MLRSLRSREFSKELLHSVRAAVGGADASGGRVSQVRGTMDRFVSMVEFGSRAVARGSHGA